MADELLLTSADVARLAGVGRAAVSNWRRRYPDFPQPVSETGGFRRDDVEHWLREQGKLALDVDADALWRALGSTGGDPVVMDSAVAVAEHLAGITTVNSLDGSVAEALENVTGDAGEIVEQLCTHVFDRQQRQAFTTPSELAELMVRLAVPVEGPATVFDPACGAANILTAAAARGANELCGQELDPALARLAKARLSLHDAAPVVTVDASDALRADAFPALRADAVVCDPPFGLREWGHDELSVDPRWEYGPPAKGEPELAWLQHCLAHARPGAAVVLAMPAGVASRRSGRVIRRALVQRGTLRAVLALPAGVLRSTGIPIHLWVLRAAAEPGDPVLLVDTVEHAPKRRGRVDWQALSEAIMRPWRQFTEHGELSTEAGKHRTIEPIELLDEEVDLTPGRHLPAATKDIDVDELEQTRQRLGAVLAELGSTLPPLAAAEPQAAHTVTLNDLARANALTLHQHSRGAEIDNDGNGPLVLTGRNVATGQPPSSRLSHPPESDATWLRPGDVVVPALAAGDGRAHPKVVTESDGHVLLGPNLHLIRVDPDRLDPQFLAGHLRSGQVRASTSTVSGVHRLDIRRVEIPMLELDRQRTQGEVFRRAAAFAEGTRDVATQAEALAAQLTDALAAGVAGPQ